jgi:hypothetical protein
MRRDQRDSPLPRDPGGKEDIMRPQSRPVAVTQRGGSAGQGAPSGNEESLQVEPIEYMTIDWDDHHVAHMIERLNELGGQGWEACAQVHAMAGDKVIGRAQPGLGLRQVPLLLLKRHRAA